MDARAGLIGKDHQPFSDIAERHEEGREEPVTQHPVASGIREDLPPHSSPEPRADRVIAGTGRARRIRSAAWRASTSSGLFQ